MKLTDKGLKYRGIILKGMVQAYGAQFTTSLMEHYELRSMVNAAAHQASEAATAQEAAAYPVYLMQRISQALKKTLDTRKGV